MSWRCSIPQTNSTEAQPIVPIEGLAVEQFIVSYPEFKSYLEDETLSEDYLTSVIDLAEKEVRYGEWPDTVQIELVYLLTAHTLQRRFEQQAKTAATAVRASMGSDKESSATSDRDSIALGVVTDNLLTTTYGQQLLRLQAQTRPDGGIVV